jgi:hypothetical protein
MAMSIATAAVSQIPRILRGIFDDVPPSYKLTVSRLRLPPGAFDTLRLPHENVLEESGASSVCRGLAGLQRVPSLPFLRLVLERRHGAQPVGTRHHADGCASRRRAAASRIRVGMRAREWTRAYPVDRGGVRGRSLVLQFPIGDCGARASIARRDEGRGGSGGPTDAADPASLRARRWLPSLPETCWAGGR